MASTPAAAAAGGPPELVAQLIFSHLLHHRCAETAALVARDMLPAAELPEAVRADVAARAEVHAAVLRGDVDGAMTLLGSRFGPDALAAAPRVAFRLKCQKFVELVAAGRVDAALAYGRCELGAAPPGPADEDLFADALSLLAYDDPAASPCGRLLSPAHRRVLLARTARAARSHRCHQATPPPAVHPAPPLTCFARHRCRRRRRRDINAPRREALAEELNSALCARAGAGHFSALERTYQQASVALAELKRLHDPRCLLVDVRAAVMEGGDGAYS